MSKTKNKKKKISEFKKFRINNFLIELQESEYVKYKDDFFDIDNLYKYMFLNSDNNKHFKNIGIFEFFKIKDHDDENVIISCLLSNTIDKKDSIDINEQIINAIDFLEKIFIYLDNIEIKKYNDYNLNKHFIIIKCLKKQTLDDIIQNINME